LCYNISKERETNPKETSTKTKGRNIMSKFYTVSLQNETIIFTAAFEKKLNNGNKEAYDLYIETKAKFPTFKIVVEEAKKRVGKYDHTTMDDIEAYIGDDEHKEWKVEFDKLFGEKIPSKTNATKSVRKVKFAVIRKWFVEKREGEEAEKAKKAREAAAKKAKRTNKKATDEDKAVEQNVPLEVANSSQQEQLDLVS
jgi:hypothetical protein